jgi:uncharacterized protein (TIGR02246 family)
MTRGASGARVLGAFVALGSAPAALAQVAAHGTVVEGQTTMTLPDTSALGQSGRAIIRLERARSAAIARHDTAWLSTVYASDLRAVAANGRRVDRAALFGVFMLDNPTARFAIDELEVRELGPDVAALTGRLRTLGPDGATLNESRYLHLYLRRDGRWQIVAAQGTVVPSAGHS